MQANTQPQTPASILVVDDTPANLQLLAGMLKDHGYKARPVPSGKLALRAAENDPPDLILLDINMPEMNGYEVCERLKADGKLKDIPVIFISAFSETLDKVKAFGVGGVDYVTKPFQFEEVEARVQAHLNLQRQKRALAESYQRLQELERLRDDLVHMIVHDMRSPLMGLCGFLELALMKMRGRADGPHVHSIQQALESARALSEMVTSLLDISRLEAGQMPLAKTSCDLRKLASEAVKSLGALTSGANVILQPPPEPVTAFCDADVIQRVIQNLIANAVKFTPAGGEIRVAMNAADAQARFEVADTGPGIPPEYHQRIFDKFGQVESRKEMKKHSTGLGLTFCKLAVEAHGGRIGLNSEVGKGSTFWFELPTTGT
jgi:signal transduction histidine kinase